MHAVVFELKLCSKVDFAVGIELSSDLEEKVFVGKRVVPGGQLEWAYPDSSSKSPNCMKSSE